MTIVRVRVNHVNNWVDRKITVPHEFNFPSSRLDKLDALYEWLEQYFIDRAGTGTFSYKPLNLAPTMFYIKEIDNKSVFTI